MIGAVDKRIIVRVIEDEEKKPKNLIIVDKKDNIWAEVIALGSDVCENVKLHERVLIQHDAGVEIEVFGQAYLSITEHQILATWEDK